MSLSTLSTAAKNPWICTEMGVDGVMCKWTITKSELLSKQNGKILRSPLFYTGNGKEQWKLELYPRGDRKDNASSSSAFLNLKSSERLPIQVKYTISILKSNKIIAKDTINRKYYVLGGWGWSKFTDQSKLLNSDCSEITVTIHCNTDTIDSRDQLTDNLRLLLKDPKFSDITIIVAGEKYTAHKSMLSVRSSVFAAMFDHEEMDENRTNEVRIEDMEPAVVEGMLEYIYTGRVGNMEGLANGLLAAAEKYDLQFLKDSSEETLCRTLDMNNAAEFLMLAHLYRASKLKESTMKFIKDNLYSVGQTDGYKKINDLELLKEIILFGAQKSE